MSDKKYNHDEMINKVVDTMSDWFDNFKDEELSHPALGIVIMSEVMNNLKMEGYCQHDISDMVTDAIDEFIDVEVSFSKEEGIEPFPIECDHNDRPSFLEVMEPISKRVN